MCPRRVTPRHNDVDGVHGACRYPRGVAQRTWSRIVGAIVKIAVDAARTRTAGKQRLPRSRRRPEAAASPRPVPRAPSRRADTSTASAGRGDAHYPGDFTGRVTAVYAPDLDGEPDPGEIVWTWVPYEEADGRGKDRPVLLVGHDGPWLLGLMLSSRDHDSRPAPADEHWVDIGTGDWDSKRRPSEVRLDRVIRIDPDGVRREGAVLDAARFDEVAGSLGSPRG